METCERGCLVTQSLFHTGRDVLCVSTQGNGPIFRWLPQVLRPLTRQWARFTLNQKHQEFSVCARQWTWVHQALRPNTSQVCVVVWDATTQRDTSRNQSAASDNRK